MVGAGDKQPVLRVAVVQAAPVFLNRAATIAKAVGPKIGLMIEIHGRLAAGDAIRFIRGRRRFHAYAGTLEGSRLPHFARVCCADVTIAHQALWYLSNCSEPHASRDI